MPVLGLGLAIAGMAFLGVAGLSWSVGFPVEVALVRGLIAFMAITFVAYLGELVVATAPPPGAVEEDAAPDAAGEDEGGREATAETEPAAGGETGREPIPLRAERDERRAA